MLYTNKFVIILKRNNFLKQLINKNIHKNFIFLFIISFYFEELYFETTYMKSISWKA